MSLTFKEWWSRRAAGNATGTGNGRGRRDGTDLRRFAESRTVGAYFGVTPKRLQTGTLVDVDGHISCGGGGEVRTALYEAVSVMTMRSKQRSALKAGDTQLAAKQGHARAVVAVAPKLAVITHRRWIDGTTFRLSAGDRDREQRTGTTAAVPHAEFVLTQNNMTTVRTVR